MWLAALLTTSCNGMFSGIYDSPDDDDAQMVDTTTNVMHFENFNVTGYNTWIYLDLHSRKMVSSDTVPTTLHGEWDGKSGITYNHGLGTWLTFIREVRTDAQREPQNWDIAIHHFDVKTNGCGVCETQYTSFEQLPVSSAELAALPFVYDEWTTDVVLFDLDGMLNYDVGYQNSYVNKVLSRWVTMDLSTPPPVYSMSDKVFVIRMKDGTFAALKLYNYMNARGIKGYLTFDIKIYD